MKSKRNKMKSFLLLLLIALLTSCDYAKQQKELTELKLQNIDLKNKVKGYELDSLFKSENEIKDPYRLRAIRIIDSLKLNDPKTLEQIEKQIEITTSTIEY
ncbi:hypothetical protein N0B16_07570 [Chryseobacterium sp. GMJ5]|uniref:Lipoprotein n=1 Tax=Chryseobacterium gilvum TaxID=2976534 RepID=A0ABT2VWC1_9FLAO|nr:hypothetical protein [Chryseobacterium gilvum]MCU7614292.1 hypothetical protein [Chryseobacterium gilvum]